MNNEDSIIHRKQESERRDDRKEQPSTLHDRKSETLEESRSPTLQTEKGMELSTIQVEELDKKNLALHSLNQESKEKDAELIQADEKSIQKRIEGIEVVVKEVNDFWETGLIGDDWTFLSMKNHNSFLIGTDKNGVLLFENGAKIYSGKIGKHAKDEGRLCGMIYIPCLNCYFLADPKILYRKGINNRPPSPFMYFDDLGLPSTLFLRYSRPLQRLIICEESITVYVVNPKRRKLEMVFDHDCDGLYLYAFTVFGEKEDQILAATDHGYFILYSINYAQKRGYVDYCQEELKGNNYPTEHISSLAVCENNKYLLVEVARDGIMRFKSSRMLIYMIFDNFFAR